MNKNKINTLRILPLLCLFAFQGSAQIVDLALETQVYPTGIIPGVRIEYGFAEKKCDPPTNGHQPYPTPRLWRP